jgi:hypothetical protein
MGLVDAFPVNPWRLPSPTFVSRNALGQSDVLVALGMSIAGIASAS